MAVSHTLIRLRCETLWPDGRNRIWLERKPRGRNAYELLAVVNTTEALTIDTVEPLLQDLTDAVHTILADGGLGQEYLPGFGAEPF